MLFWFLLIYLRLINIFVCNNKFIWLAGQSKCSILNKDWHTFYYAKFNFRMLSSWVFQLLRHELILFYCYYLLLYKLVKFISVHLFLVLRKRNGFRDIRVTLYLYWRIINLMLFWFLLILTRVNCILKCKSNLDWIRKQ